MYFINDTEPVSDKLFRENFDCADVERLLADFLLYVTTIVKLI